MTQRFEVEVVYALPEKQHILPLLVKEGVCVREVIERSGVLKRFPQISLEKQKIGIFGRLISLDDLVQPGDRIEIYRPLLADPKEIRRQRAERAKQEGRANKVTGGRVHPQSS